MAPLVLVVAAACSAPREDRPAPPSASAVPSATSTAEAPPASASVTAAPAPPPPWVHASPESATACPAGMLLVEGDFTPSAGHRCVEWISEKHDRCRKYAPPPLRAGKVVHQRYCIDRYEYPNLEGVRPAVMPDWFDAKESCEREDKRLCTSSEWTLACEGTEVLPYPYGYERNPALCNIDRPRPSPEPDFDAFSIPRKIGPEVDRLDLRIASGEKPSCQSPFGVADMTGNVDEWVVNEKHFDGLEPGKEEKDRPYVSGLKGGYWGPIRARCRPMTSSHNPWFRFYQVGFRCCRDPLDGSFQGRKLDHLLPKHR
jgi:formylglycine-generating enzyme required for sulfatase activity